MPTPEVSADMTSALIRLRKELEDAPLGLDLPEAQEIRAERQSMVNQLDDYILPRLVQADAPLLAVVGGSTGAGKSTLVNSLVGKSVTKSGVLRPTTRSPVLVHHPKDSDWFEKERILPDLKRTTNPTNDVGALQLKAVDSVPTGIAILDAPDVDSVDAGNRALAAQLLAASDLWLFVTSAARYADDVPWTFLKLAAQRNAAVAIVLDRTTDKAIQEVRGHLARMLTARGLKDCPLFAVPESRVDAHGLLPQSSVEQLRNWLVDLAANDEVRTQIIQQTLDGAVRQVVYRAHAVADASAAQHETSERLAAEVGEVYDRAVREISGFVRDGAVLRGEVLVRWREFVGGDLARSLEQKVSRVRDRMMGALRGKPQAAEQVGLALERGLQMVIVERAETSASRAAARWSEDEAGAALVDGANGTLARASRDLRVRADRIVREWQREVLEMVRMEGSDKRVTARFLAYGVTGLGVTLMVVVFAGGASTNGGSHLEEAEDAAEAASIGERILESVFGADTMRRMADSARTDLERRCRELFEAEKSRYLTVLEGASARPDAASRLRDVARAADDVRHGAGVI
ncbi:MAG TPA: dynamin family protein [Nocardioidaceae bacterium]|nr:dynamin family protein [Nocardioidaceae bacterium]